jgi:hypothetical protein
VSRLLLAAAVLTIYLVLHALSWFGDDDHPGVLEVVAHSVDSEHHHGHDGHHPVDHCDTGTDSHPSHTSYPHWLAAPRAAESGGIALPAAPFPSLVSLAPAADLWRARSPGHDCPPTARSGQEILHAFCVSRR